MGTSDCPACLGVRGVLDGLCIAHQIEELEWEIWQGMDRIEELKKLKEKMAEERK